MSFDCIVPHEAHDKFVSGLTLVFRKVVQPLNACTWLQVQKGDSGSGGSC